MRYALCRIGVLFAFRKEYILERIENGNILIAFSKDQDLYFSKRLFQYILYLSIYALYTYVLHTYVQHRAIILIHIIFTKQHARNVLNLRLLCSRQNNNDNNK